MLNEKLDKKRTKTTIVKHAYPVLRGAVNNRCFFRFFVEKSVSIFPKYF